MWAESRAGHRPKRKFVNSARPKVKASTQSIQGDILQTRHASRTERDNGVASPERDQKSQKTTEERDDHAFDQKLADDLAAVGAQRGADGEFTGAPGAAHREKIRQICARDEQDQRDCAKQQGQIFLIRADLAVEEQFDVRARFQRLSAEYRFSRPAAIDFICVCACSIVTPGFSLPQAKSPG